MSSLYVRDTLRGWLTDAAAGYTLAFADTVNVEVAPTGPRWSTLNFVSSDHQPTTYCGDQLETGTFDFIALGPAGVGDRELIAAAEHDVALLLGQVDPLLTLWRASPPQDFLQGGSVPWYTVSMVITYQCGKPAAGLP